MRRRNEAGCILDDYYTFTLRLFNITLANWLLKLKVVLTKTENAKPKIIHLMNIYEFKNFTPHAGRCTETGGFFISRCDTS
jgi:hypothetical protein